MADGDLKAAHEAISELNTLEKSDPDFKKGLEEIKTDGKAPAGGMVAAAAAVDALKKDPAFAKATKDVKLSGDVNDMHAVEQAHKEVKTNMDKADIKAVPQTGGREVN